MNLKSFFKRTPVKILLTTLAMCAMAVLGGIPVTIVMVMRQELYIKILIASAGVLWGIFTIIWIWAASDYNKLWKSWLSEMKGARMQRMLENFPEYMELRRKYPLSLQRHERHCMHRKPKVSYKQMIESALKVDEKEWAAREEFHQQNRAERRAYRDHRPPTLREIPFSVLFCGNVLVDILAAPEGIEEYIGKAYHHNPVAGLIACRTEDIHHSIHEQGEDAAAAHQRHEETGGTFGVFTQAFDSKVEDSAPHHRGAKTHADKQGSTKRYEVHPKAMGTVETGETDHGSGGNEDGKHHQQHSSGGNHGNHLACGHLAAHQSANQSAHQHKQPVERRYRTGHCLGADAFFKEMHLRILQSFVQHMAHTYLYTHRDEDGDGTQHKMAELENTLEGHISRGGLF